MFASGRRDFLKIFGLSAIGLVAFCPQSAYATNPTSCWIDEGFGPTERAIIRKACYLAVERLQKEEVWERVYAHSKYSLITGSVADKFGIRNKSNVKWDLLRRQLYWLSQPNGPTDTEPAFPYINIKYGHDKPQEGYLGWLGRARLDTVSIYSDGKETRQRGHFEITLNDYYVGRGNRYSDPNDWAGTIAHEMLHNLGHEHPDTSDPDYRKYQINVLDEIIQNYGYSSKGAYGFSSSGSRQTLLSLHGCRGSSAR